MTGTKDSWVGRASGPVHVLLKHCREVVKGLPEPGEAARLLYFTGRVFEECLGDIERARERYLEAFGRDPGLKPNLRAARRLMANAEDWHAVLDLIDAELRSDLDPHDQAESNVERGKILEQELWDIAAAREAYACAMELDEDNPEAWRLLERALFQLEEWVELDDLLARVIVRARSPRLQAAMFVRRAAIQERRIGDENAAVEMLEEALTLQPDLAPAYQGLKRLFRATRRWDDLIELLQRELGLLDGRAKIRAYSELARLYTRHRGRTDLAIDLLEKAERIEPQDVLVLTELAGLYRQAARAHDQLRVEGCLASILEDVEERVAIHLRLGAICEEQLGDRDTALEHFRAAIELKPGYPPAARALGRLCNAIGRWDILLEMNKAEAKSAVDVERQALAHYRAAELLELRLGRADDGIEQYEEAARWLPALRPASRALNRLYRERGRWDKLAALLAAEADGLRGRSLIGQSQDALRLARLEQAARLHEDKLGDPDTAVGLYQVVLETDPTHAGAILALQRLHEGAGRWNELIGLLEREVELVHDETWNAGLLHQIGEIAREQLGDEERAVACYQRALALCPDFVPSLVALGRFFRANQRWRDLIAMHRREGEVAETQAEQAAVLFQIAEIEHRELRDQDAAERSYRECLELAPGFWPAWHALEQLLADRRDWEGLAGVMEHRARQRTAPIERAHAFLALGDLLEKRLDRRDQAADMYRLALEAAPDFQPARTALIRLYEEQESWRLLADQLEEETRDAHEGFFHLEALIDLVAIRRSFLDDPEGAIESAEKVVDLEPDNLLALLDLTDLYRQQERWDELARTCRRLALATDDSLILVSALRELAGVLREKLDRAAEADAVFEDILSVRPDDLMVRRALDAIIEPCDAQRRQPAVVSAAIEVLCLAPDTMSALTRLLDELNAIYVESGDWAGLTQALQEVRDELTCLGAPRDAHDALDVAQARLEGERLERPVSAEERLLAVLGKTPDDLEARVALADLLGRETGRRDDAVAQYRHVLAADPAHETATRGLHELWHAAGLADRAHCALGALCALGLATDEERARHASRQVAREQGHVLKRSLLTTRVNHGASFPAEAMALLMALDPHHPVLFPADLAPFDLRPSERMRKGHDHPLRRVAEGVAHLLDVADFDLCLHEVRGLGAGFEPTDPPTVVLPWHALDWPVAEQAFALARVMARPQLQTWLAARRTARELDLVLAAATRLHVTGFAIAEVSEDLLDERSEEVSCLLPQDVIDGFEEQAVAYARAPRPDFDAWLAAMNRSAARAGLLLGGDLEAAMTGIRRSAGDATAPPALSAEQRAELVRGDAAVRDLVQWHLSDDHHLLRRMARLDVR